VLFAILTPFFDKNKKGKQTQSRPNPQKIKSEKETASLIDDTYYLVKELF
jgi:hypothetical protein